MNERDSIPGRALPAFIPGKGTMRFGARGGPGGAPLPLPGGAPYPTPALNASVSLDPPTWVRPPSARDFQLFGTLAGANAATTPALLPLATFAIPTGNVGVIRSAVFLVNGLLVTSDVRFTIFYNNGAVEGWAGIPVLPRLAASVSASFGPDETAIPVPENITVTVGVNVTDGGVYQVSAALHGWFYPKEIGQAFDAAYNF